MSDAELAKVAYEAYGKVTDYKNYQGLQMPKWEELSETIQKAWCAAAIAAWKHGLDFTMVKILEL